MVSLPTSSDSEHDLNWADYYGEDPFEFEHKGFPENCFCGEDAILEKKRTGPDAGRLYYRCANSQYQDNTAHLGKWFEEAVQEEWQIMRKDISRLQSCERVDNDYIRRLHQLETSHEKLGAAVTRLAEDVEGWWDQCKIMAADVIEEQAARRKIWSRIRLVTAMAGMGFSLVAAIVIGIRMSQLG